MSSRPIRGNTEWFIGELVEEFQAADQPENLVHINTILIQADSPEVAYEKALSLGESANRVFTNSDGIEAELLYEKREGMSDEAIAKMVKPKEELAVFSPTWDDK